MKPGEYLLDATAVAIRANDGRKTTTVRVANRGDRPIQVGSHFPFSEANSFLAFDREAACGMHLNIPAGMAVRFEPGERKDVTLVAFGGTGKDLEPYTKVQFIAHVIHTAPKSQREYIGLDVASDDIAERIKLVGNVIESARSRPETKQADASVLKLFMMPEFFFRGKTGAYSMDDVQRVVSGLQNLVKDVAKWEHWLFVFGTIVGHSTGTPVSGTDVEAYNYVLVQKGGFGDAPGAGPAAAKAVVKEFLSGIDFIPKAGPEGGIYLERVQHLAPLEPPGSRSEEQVTSYDGSAVFRLGAGLTIGLEVCLDHALKRLKTSVKLPVIDVQLVPSCGMIIQDDSIVAKAGGCVFLCDGLSNYPSRTPPYNSRVKKIGTGEINPVLESDVDVTGIRIDKIFVKGPGKLRIYPAQDLA